MAATLDQDVAALLADIEDRREAEDLRSRIDEATDTDWEPKAEIEYKPFVYPH